MHWLLILLSCLLVIFVSSVNVSDSGFLQFHCAGLLSALNLLLGEGNAWTKLELLILISGCVILAYYEIHLTSVALTPNPPFVYVTIKDLLQAGYQILLASGQATGGLNRILSKKGVLELSKQGFHMMNPEETADKVAPASHEAMLTVGTHLPTFVENKNVYASDALCHAVAEIGRASCRERV